MTTDKMRIWNALCKTDPKHVKPFKRAGGFSGTAMKPIWVIKQMTELFGPAGSGWGMGTPQFQTVNAGDEILVFCTIELWYSERPGDRGSVYGVGGDKVLGKNKYGPFTNDEAFKASYTDALSNAMKQIGVGADIHMGLFDDEKYVRETQREFAGGGQGAALEQAAREITAATGESRSTYQIAKAAKPKMTPKEWADMAIMVLNSAATVESVNNWWKQNDKALQALQADHEAEYERVAMCADDARASLRNHQ